MAASFGAHAVGTAFWEPYVVDEHTYALISFDDPDPLTAEGQIAGPGELSGDARLTRAGFFGGGLRLKGQGYAAFPTFHWDPSAMAENDRIRSISCEAWIKVERYPEAGGRGDVVFRPDHDGAALGFSLFVDAEGALGMTVKGVGNAGATFKSGSGVVPLGEWAHIAGISSAGQLYGHVDSLFVNGKEVFSAPSSTDGGGFAPDREPARLFIGGPPGQTGLVGHVDEVRIHARVGKFWSPEAMPFIERIAMKGMPPVDEVIVQNRQPWLVFPFDEVVHPVVAPDLITVDPAIAENIQVHFEGEYVPGVSGSAAVGTLRIGGMRLADWREGSLEFWFRPRGVNNISDRNVRIFSGSGLTVYFSNNIGPFKPLSFYYRDSDGQTRLYKDERRTEVHPGRWYHLALTWDSDMIDMYIDGHRAASGANLVTTGANAGVLDEIHFTTMFDVDELAFYAHPLTESEVANRYWSYVNPDKVVPAEIPAPLTLRAWWFPSTSVIHYQLTSIADVDEIEAVRVQVSDEQGRVVATSAGVIGAYQNISTPDLEDGVYTVRAVVMHDGKELRSDPVSIRSQSFDWEGNQLGITDTIFPPFEPLTTDGDTVSVVQRRYRMNHFGLWDSVHSMEREILDGPIRLQYETASGASGIWRPSDGSFVSSEPHQAIYRARIMSAAVNIETVSEIEVDGMMKVTMTLEPGSRPETITRMWLEIPVKSSEAELMHEDTGSLRYNYSGSIPKEQGTVWYSRRNSLQPWRNAFTGYIWIGGVERGIAWFGENDRGWITEKNLSEKPLQEIIRDGDRVVIRVNLINTPAMIEEPHEIVFGLQASPAKPMPADWRTGERGGGLPVTAWGGLQTADKFPFDDRWEIVDKIIESQLTGKDQREWFEHFQEEHDVPPPRGTQDWIEQVVHFAGQTQRPILTYFEEMAAPTYRREWHVYKDEWSYDLLSPRREWPDGHDVFRQGRWTKVMHRSNFSDSYRDYAAYYANEWLRRGVGIYWDNAYLTTTVNPLTSAAYLAEDGHIQPALTLWNQREYSRRIWNLLHQWQRKRDEKLLFVQHMTNTSLLPILAWCTTSLDNEFSARVFALRVAMPRRHDEKEPFAPDYLRAQSMGQQAGNYPVLNFGLFWTPEHFDIDPRLIPKTEMDTPNRMGRSIYAQKREWGMCRVHEIPAWQAWRPASAILEAALIGFGYDSPTVDVHNYWAERPALRIDREDVKWLLLARPSDKRLMLILQSWSRHPEQVDVFFDFDVIGFRPRPTISNLETGVPLRPLESGFELAMETPYDLKVIGVGAPPSPAHVLLSEDFSDGPSPRWSNMFDAPVVSGESGEKALRLARSSSQLPRIELWDGVEEWQDAALSIEFHIPSEPDGRRSLFSVITRAETPEWSPHGLSNTRLNSGQSLELRTNGAQWELVRWTVDSGGTRGDRSVIPLGLQDDRRHVLSIVMKGAHTHALFDQRLVATFDDTPQQGAAFGIYGSRDLSESMFVDLYRVVLISN